VEIFVGLIIITAIVATMIVDFDRPAVCVAEPQVDPAVQAERDRIYILGQNALYEQVQSGSLHIGSKGGVYYIDGGKKVYVPQMKKYV
jgi:hypothetical protein